MAGLLGIVIVAIGGCKVPAIVEITENRTVPQALWQQSAIPLILQLFNGAAFLPIKTW